MELTKFESRLCVTRLILLTIGEYRSLKKGKKLTKKQQMELESIKRFLFGEKSAAPALELVFGEKIEKIRKAIKGNDLESKEKD